MKFCKDCKHCNRIDSETVMHRHSVCSVKVISTDNVSGTMCFDSCRSQRSVYGLCKPTAILFETTPSMWVKLKNIFRKPL
jgi:hypothetical protein